MPETWLAYGGDGILFWIYTLGLRRVLTVRAQGHAGKLTGAHD